MCGRHLYAKCRNQLHVRPEPAYSMDLREASRRIGTLVQPMTEFHGKRMQKLRTRDGCQEFWLEACTWQHVGELLEMMHLLLDQEALDEMGFDMNPVSKLTRVVISEDHSSEDDLAHSIWELAYQFLKSRAALQFFYARAFPFVLACSLSPSPAERQRVVTDIQRAHERFQKCCQSSNATVKRVFARSSLNQPICRVSSNIVAHANFPENMQEALMLHLSRLFSGFATSKMCEDVNRRARGAETRKQESKTMSRVRRSLVPVTKHMIQQWGRRAAEETRSASPAPRAVRDDLFRVSEASESQRRCQLQRGVARSRALHAVA